jgi:hypothetical protein
MRTMTAFLVKPKRAAVWLVALPLLLLAAQSSRALQIVISTGAAGWTVTIPAAPSPVPAAGRDFTTTTYPSATNQTVLRVNSPFTGGLTGWIVYVRRTYTATWGPNLHLWIRRTSNGVPAGRLVGPLNVYQEITNVNTELFRCNTQTQVTTIRCQLQITGVSAPVLATPNDLTSVTYTVTEF